MGVVHGSPYLPMDEDPDDYRPTSSWSLHVDPDQRTGLSVIWETIGVGDRIPRHWHDIDEVVLYEGGRALVSLDGVETEVEGGATVFIPAGVIHGTMNVGDEPVRVRAIYPSTVVRMDLVERNPMPGTEEQRPRASVYDMATGTFTVLHETEVPPERR
ncbi:cupin domain-containing protein [Nocardioides antri]|uniref:Cupin domain-containing protein n=1 Tax=Nocardioides antri TaxID=2607659 RepID=A0A5B1M7D7_9ACTN|nr:cupin domain-containing protein [Nocardioides antri]KAA1429175.1 cupin domain-containing protein [Nocardioides antri]